MPTKKKPTEQELKDRLWEMVKQLDFSEYDISEITNDSRYDKWDDDMRSRQQECMAR